MENQINNPQLIRALQGCLLGTALGDALGLPCEGLTQQRQLRLFPNLERFHFLLGRGMVSDDTEHLCLTAQALISSKGDPQKFTHQLAWKLRIWLLCLPAGVGLSSLKGILRLWLGISPERSGVFSAGNGPAMRVAILGILFYENPEKLKTLIRSSTRLTHTDPRAEWGALAIALAAGMAARQQQVKPQDYYQELRSLLPEEAHKLLLLVHSAMQHALNKTPFSVYLAELGCQKGISGYMYHTVPAVLFMWFSESENFLRSVTELIRAGGDTDTSAALLGGIIGAQIGPESLPQSFKETLWEWPRSIDWMMRLGERLGLVLGAGQSLPALPLHFYLILPRNFIFLLTVLIHGFRRLLPPY
jgi:ADP-ribosyl-[dinitrogen reductase] hydrolase